MYKLWPGRDKWYALALPTPQESGIYGQPDSDYNSAWRKDRVRWSQGRKMLKGDWYELYLDKPRLLSEFVIRSQSIRFPKKIRLRTKEKDNSNQWRDEITSEVETNQEEQPVIFVHRFPKHYKVKAIRLEIIEPNEEKWILGEGKGRHAAWSIYDIEPKEYRLFGCLWEHKIG